MRIRLARDSTLLGDIQQVFNAKEVIGYLGGFTLADSLKQKAVNRRPSLWYAENEAGIVGAAMFAGRPQAHIAKYGEIGVFEKYRRQRIATAFYAAMTIQGITEGRRLFEDTIVGDNPIQFDLLPTVGMRHAGELQHKTASAKSIHIFQLDLLSDTHPFGIIMGRVPDHFRLEVVMNSYTQDLWEKNFVIYEKKLPDFKKVMRDFMKAIQLDPRVELIIEEEVEKKPVMQTQKLL